MEPRASVRPVQACTCHSSKPRYTVPHSQRCQELWRRHVKVTEIRPLSALIPIPSPRFLEHDFPRLSLGESTGIEKGQTNR